MSNQTTLCANVMCAAKGLMNNLVLETGSDSNTGSISSATDSVPLLTLKNTNTDANSGSVLQMKSHPSNNAQADNDEIGLISFVGVDDAGATAEYGSILCSAVDASAGSENGKISINVTTAGARTEVMSITSGIAASDATDSIVSIPGTLGVGGKKFTSFAGSLAATNAAGTAYADNDVLVELGSLDISLPSGFDTTAQKILIERVVICVEVAAGQTLVGHLSLSATSGTATNAAIDTPTEIVGAGATQLSPEGYSLATTATEADIDFDTAGVTFASPGIVVGPTLINLYACTTTTVNADITAGRFNVMVEYTVL